MSGHDADDERTDVFSSAPTYEQAPATIEQRPSPFHRVGSRKPTAPGMPAPIVVPPIVPVAEPDLAGPTDPDGHPLAWESGETWGEDSETAVMRPRPAVPAPDAPKIEVSQSLMLESVDVQAAVRAAKVKTLAARKGARKPARRHVPQEGPGPAAQTYQMLPALRREKDEDGSDLPLILGLIVLALVIAGLAGVGAYALVRANDDGASTVTE